MAVGVVFLVFCVQSRTFCAVCGVGVADMRRLCFPIVTSSIRMVNGDGAGMPPVARLVWCRLCVWGALSRKLYEGGKGDHKLGCWRRMSSPVCAKPLFSSIHMPYVRAHASW